jgi:hypothetical protein
MGGVIILRSKEYAMAKASSLLLLFLMTNCSSLPQAFPGEYSEDSAWEFFEEALRLLKDKDYQGVSRITSQAAIQGLHGLAQDYRGLSAKEQILEYSPRARALLLRFLETTEQTELEGVSREDLIPLLLEKDYFSFDEAAYKARDFSLVGLDPPQSATYNMLETGLPRYFRAVYAVGGWSLEINGELTDMALSWPEVGAEDRISQSRIANNDL